jgi:Amt family ammonium transporter
LAAFGGALAASLYAWFTTGTLDVLMSGRGMAAGLVVTAASAPFIPAWAALAAGLLVGLLLPLLIYVLDHKLCAGDVAAVVVTFGFPAVLGLLLPGLLANGRYGAGWNRVGADSFLGVAGQGVSGAWVPPGLVPDWPGQLSAQLIGLAAIALWSFSLSWLLLSVLRGIIQVRERSRSVFETTPAAVGQADAVQPAVASNALDDRAVQSPLSPLAGEPD